MYYIYICIYIIIVYISSPRYMENENRAWQSYSMFLEKKSQKQLFSNVFICKFYGKCSIMLLLGALRYWTCYLSK